MFKIKILIKKIKKNKKPKNRASKLLFGTICGIGTCDMFAGLKTCSRNHMFASQSIYEDDTCH